MTGFFKKRPIHFSPLGKSYRDDQVYRIFLMSEEMKLGERRKMETKKHNYTETKTTKSQCMEEQGHKKHEPKYAVEAC